MVRKLIVAIREVLFVSPFESYYAHIRSAALPGGPTEAEAKRDYQIFLDTYR